MGQGRGIWYPWQESALQKGIQTILKHMTLLKKCCRTPVRRDRTAGQPVGQGTQGAHGTKVTHGTGLTRAKPMASIGDTRSPNEADRVYICTSDQWLTVTRTVVQSVLTGRHKSRRFWEVGGRPSRSRRYPSVLSGSFLCLPIEIFNRA